MLYISCDKSSRISNSKFVGFRNWSVFCLFLYYISFLFCVRHCCHSARSKKWTVGCVYGDIMHTVWLVSVSFKHSSFDLVEAKWTHSTTYVRRTHTCGSVINGISEIRWYRLICLVVHQLTLYGHLSECVQRSGYGHNQRRSGEGLQNTIGFWFSIFQLLRHTVREATDRRSTLQGPIVHSWMILLDTV